MRVLVRVPATVANLGPGFDAMAMALGVYNYLEVTAPSQDSRDQGSSDVGFRRVVFDIRGEGSSILPLDQSNLIYRAMSEVSRRADKPLPRVLFVRSENAIPLARGLGSSASAIVAGAAAANDLLGKPFDLRALLDIAAEMEGHPDNVAAAVLGGVVVVVKKDDRGVPDVMEAGGGVSPFEHLSLPVPAFRALLFVPKVEVRTEDARRVLPTLVPMRDVVFSLGRAALLAGCLGLRDTGVLKTAMDDRIHEPYRLSMVPGLREAYDSLRRSGAEGVAVAGSGPTLLAFVAPGKDPAPLIREATACFNSHGIDVQVIQTRPSFEGVRTILTDSEESFPAETGLAGAFESRKVLVQKFGGSSLADPERIVNVTRHVLRAKAQGYSPVLVVSAMGDTTDELIRLSRQVCDDPSAREMDMLLSTGEQVSAALVALALESKGCSSVSLTGAQAGILTDSTHSRAAIASIEPSRIVRALDEGRVPVVTGFQGIGTGGEITTLGRGGSDTSAVALAAALDAEQCEIYTDVEGVYTADPRVVPDAAKLPEVAYDEMAEMAGLGAKVLQHRSVEMARAFGVRVHIRSSFSDGTGTVLKEGGELQEGYVIRSVAHSTDETRIVLEGVRDVPGMAAKIFRALAEGNIKVDAIIQASRRNGVNDVVFTVGKDDVEAALEASKRVAAEIGAKGVKHESGLAKISVIGSGVCQDASVAAIMFETLAELGINIEMISTSATRISVIVVQDGIEDAVRALHARFGLGQAGSGAGAA